MGLTRIYRQRDGQTERGTYRGIPIYPHPPKRRSLAYTNEDQPNNKVITSTEQKQF